MTTVVPQSELMRNAISWVSEKRKESGAPLEKLLDDAGMRFNLSPNDQEFLRKFFSDPENQ